MAIAPWAVALGLAVAFTPEPMAIACVPVLAREYTPKAIEYCDADWATVPMAMAARADPAADEPPMTISALFVPVAAKPIHT